MGAYSQILKNYLMPYQLDWLKDTSRFKMGMWSRQTGKSFATAAETVLNCLERPRSRWVVLSAGERQAIEWMEKAKFFVRAFQRVKEFSVKYDETLNEADASLSRCEIKFDNGSRISAIPANPDTARGYSCNVVLDEFAIHENPEEIWAAIYPSITSPHGGEKKLRIVSTPKGRGNKFADLWEHNDGYSCHKLTIEDAVAQGLKLDLDVLKRGLDDPDIWAQEYMCEFIDNTSVLLPYDMIGKCESANIADDGISPLYVGMDVGRSKDLSVIVTAQRCGDVLSVIDVSVLVKMPFADQLDVLLGKCGYGEGRPVAGGAFRNTRQRLAAVRIDSTGIGAMLAEEATRRLGGICQGVVFTAKTKGEMFGRMRRRFEDRAIRVPVSRELREDLHAVQRLVSVGGTVTYAAPRNADGHSDRAAALALVVEAANAAPFVAPFAAPPRRPYEERTIR